MKKLASVSVFIFLLLTISFSEISAQQLPMISGETIDKQKKVLPTDLKGKFSFISFASSQKAQKDLEGWLDPVYQKYIAKTGIMDDMFDVNVYFIPLVKSGNKMIAESMKRKFSESAQDDLKPHVLFSETDADLIIQALNMTKSDVPYFFLLDKDSKIVYRTSGAFTEEKFDAIDDLVE